MRLSLFSLATLSLFACQTPQIASQGSRIINGELDLDHPAVVGLTDDIGDSFCSGTYVGDKTVVTAAHCFEGGPPPTFIYFGQNINADADACNDGDDAACEQFIEVDLDGTGPHPDYDPKTDVNDIGVVKLVKDPTDIAPSPFLREDDGTGLSTDDEGADVIFVGFGFSDGINDTDNDLRLQVAGVLDRVGPGDEPELVDIIAGVLDNSQVFYLQPDGGPCSGDSGGPMFIQRDGQDFLAAVTSFGDADCVEFGVSTRVDLFTDLITGDLAPGDPDDLNGFLSGCSVSHENTQTEAPVLMLLVLSLGFAFTARRRS